MSTINSPSSTPTLALADAAVVVPLILATRLLALHTPLRHAHQLGYICRPNHRRELVDGVPRPVHCRAVAHGVAAIAHVRAEPEAVGEHGTYCPKLSGAGDIDVVALDGEQRAHKAERVADRVGVEGGLSMCGTAATVTEDGWIWSWRATSYRGEKS